MTELETEMIPYETRRYDTRRKDERILQEEEKIIYIYIKRGGDMTQRREEKIRQEKRI